MVVVFVIWVKTGATLVAREAATRQMDAGFLNMVFIVARLVFVLAESAGKPV